MFGSRLKKIPIRWLSSIAIAGLLPLQAQEEKKPASHQNNYSAAFQKLINLGLPDAQGATYIKLDFSEETHANRSHHYQQYTIKRKGNAWLLPAEDAESKVRSVIHDGFRLAQVATNKKRGLLARLVTREDTKTVDGVRKAKWSEIDATQEVDKIIKQLETNNSLSRMFDASSWSYDTSAISVLADLLITACHLNRSGQVEAGDKLAHFILNKAPYPFKVIDHVIGKLAAAEYRALLDQLFTDQKWDPFLKGIRKLSTKYPRGWDNQPGIKILTSKVVSHLRLGKGRIVPFKGQALDLEIISAFDKLLSPAKPGQSINASSPSCWLINPEGKTESDYGRARPTPEWLAGIVTRGMDALPTLIAASTDDTLIPAPFFGSNSSSSGMHFSGFGRNQKSDEDTYHSMPRPCSRGEIARAILKQTLPTSDETSGELLSPGEFQLMAHDWWKENKDKSTTEITLLFLENGGDEQKSIALKALLASDAESAFPIVENFILDSDHLMNQIGLAHQYLQKRKAKGKKFYDTFIAKLREEMESRHSGNGMQEQMEQYFKQSISALSVLVNDIPPEKIMAQITSGETPLEEGLPLLGVAIGEGNHLAKLGPLLSFISKLEKPADRLSALESLLRWTYDREQSPSKEGELSDSQKERRKLASTHLDIWKTFLSRKENPQIENKALIALGLPTSEAHYAAMVMNTIHFPESSSLIYAVNNVASTEEAWDVLLDRMETFSNTGEASPFPAADLVPEDRQQAILAKIKELPTQEIITYRKSLPISERIAAAALLQNLKEVPENIAALGKICQEIDWSRASEVPQALRQKLETLILEKEISTSLMNTTIKTLSTGKVGLMLFFQKNNNALNGPRIMAWTTATSNGWLESYISEDLGKLDGKKITHLEALVTYGVTQEEDEPSSTSLFFAPIDEAKEKAAFDELLKKALTLFEPSEGEESRRRQAGFVLISETFENHSASTEEEEDDE